MNQEDSTQIPKAEGNNFSKIYLGDIKNPTLRSFVRTFRVDKETAKNNSGKIWLDVDFKHDYQKDEMRGDKFHLMVQGTDTVTGMSIEITEENLQLILDTMKEIKSNVYCMDDSFKKKESL